ncbi:RNA polymerase sigma factor [Gluconacetobacter sacchari]|uniref:RNA polymerase sigma factor n=2 Tax=Gluconacetobacter sacchari TaxID=92759 RepID=A0A7W4ICS9_9PROT|nr:RNA polymerase sigma factor [Gluconacetobacter sacchari]MBB2160339.1 RNA polymerase sigma factor [Gluconacetobacter sacchari]
MSEWVRSQSSWSLLLLRIQRRTGRSDADDLLQSAFLKLLELKPGNIRNVEAYLVRAAQNAACDSVRRERNGPISFVDDEHMQSVPCTGPTPVETAMSRQRLDTLARSIQDLDERTKEIFLLHRIEGLSYPQIAERVGCTVSNVEKHISKTLVLLAKRLLD